MLLMQNLRVGQLTL